MNDSCCCTRELTLEEEINNLNIDSNVKERMLYKLSRMEEEQKRTYGYLDNCHREIDRLERAIVELSLSLGEDRFTLRCQGR